MSECPTGHCGYTWPEDHEISDSAFNQSCCYRESFPDTGYCVLHADLDEKPAETFQEAYPTAESREKNTPFAALFDGAILTDIEVKGKSFKRTAFRNATLAGADLRNADLTEASFRYANLKDVNFSEATLNAADLRIVDLSEANLGSADLADADLRNADLTGAVLRIADLSEANLGSADLADADLRIADLPKANLESANLTKVSCHRANLFEANLGSADLAEADLRDADLSAADLRNADLSEANLMDADLTRADLRFADLTAANLKDADLTRADLRFADLTAANLKDADLTEADLKEADLNDANLSKADLTGTVLRESNLQNVDFARADLHDVDFSGANLNDVDFSEVAVGNAKIRVNDLMKFPSIFESKIEDKNKTIPSLESSQPSEYWVGSSVLLLSALYKERDSLISLLRDYDSLRKRSGGQDSTIFEGPGDSQFIVKAEGETGNARIRQTAKLLIEEYNPEFVILYGIAAGFKQRVDKADIIVADKVIDLRKYKIGDRYYFEPDIIESPASLEYPFKIESLPEAIDQDNMSPEIHIDLVIGSSDTLSRKEKFMESAKDTHRKIGGLEMEGAGVAEACAKNDKGFFIIKSISDYGGPQKDDSLHSVCCHLSAETVVKGFLMERHSF